MNQDKKTVISKAKNLIRNISSLKERSLSTKQVRVGLTSFIRNSGFTDPIIKDLIATINKELDQEVNQYTVIDNIINTLKSFYKESNEE